MKVKPIIGDAFFFGSYLLPGNVRVVDTPAPSDADFPFLGKLC